MNKKKCVTFWVDENIIKTFDSIYHEKSIFMRECMKRATQDKEFYFKVMCEGKKHEKEVL